MIEALPLALCAFGLGFSIGSIFWISHYTISHYIAMAKESAAPRVTLQSPPPGATCATCDFALDVPHAHWLGEWEGWHVSWNCQAQCEDGIVMEWPFPNKTLVTVADFEQAGFMIS